jgi:hypothetical protein
MVESGHPQEQAVAAALRKSREDEMAEKKDQEAEKPVKETKTTVKEPAGEEKPDPKAQLKAAEDELEALEREQEQSEEGRGRQNAIDDQKKVVRQLRDEMREVEHKERMGVADAIEQLEQKQDSDRIMKLVNDAIAELAGRMDTFAERNKAQMR